MQRNIGIAAIALVLTWLSTGQADASTLPTHEEMEAALEQIDVWQNELVPGEYEAPEFAADFQLACAASTMPSPRDGPSSNQAPSPPLPTAPLAARTR